MELFRSLGRAKINKLRKSATAATSRDTLKGVDLPSMTEISGIMGQPTDKNKKDRRRLWNYVFNFPIPEAPVTIRNRRAPSRVDSQASFNYWISWSRP